MAIKKSERNSTLEFLRILSMIGVLSLHYMNKNIGGGLNTTLPLNILLTHLIESVCIISVNVFVLISGFFMINQMTTGLKKAIELYLIMLCYRLIFFAVGIVLNETAFSWKELAITVVPFAVGKMWFLETYILLLLFVPFVNILISQLNKHTHLLLLFLWFMVYSVWSSFFPSPPLTDNGYGVTNFITLYFISTYIKKYVPLPKTNKVILISILVYIISVLLTTVSSFSYFSKRAWGYCYLFNIIASTAIFYVFLNLPKAHSNFINTVAGLTFGVYICHADPHIQRTVYHRIMQIERFVNSPTMIIHFIVCVVLQFAFFAGIDYIRQLLWKPTVSKWLSNSRLLKTEQNWETAIFSSCFSLKS